MKLLIGPSTLSHAILYGQIRGIIGGATAMVLDANAQIPPLPPSSINRGPNVDVMTVLDPACLAVVGATPTIATAQQHLATGGRLHAHCAEGAIGDAYCAQEFAVLDQNGLLGNRTTLIHALGVDGSGMSRIAQTGTSLVWSPVSNMNLYGRTLDAQSALARGITVALAPDWTVSGSSTILDEARWVLTTQSWLRPTRLLEMITEIPARLLGLTTGVLQPGAAADLVVFGGSPNGGSHDDIVRDVLSRRHEDIALVIAAGAPVYGTPPMMQALGVAPTTSIHVPTQSGQSVLREIALSPSSFAQTVQTLRTALQRDPAPIWEAS